MKLLLKNYRTILSADLVKKATKNIVRECDEIKEGHFQAYVDDKKDTFDTAIVFNNKGEIIENHCDCPNVVAFCNHKAALLLHLINGQRTVLKLKSSKKEDPLVKLINDVDPEKIKIWLLDLFSKNKDLSITFTHEFSRKEEPYTPEELKKLSLDAVKAVVNNRKIVEIAEVKRIIELWKALHESVIEDYTLQMNNEKAFLRLDAIIGVIHEVKYKLRTTSSRFESYSDDILLKLLPLLNQTHDEEYWDLAVNYFVERIHIDSLNMRQYYLFFLIKLYNLSNEDRKKRLALNLVTQYIGLSTQKFSYKDNYVATVFKMIVNCGLFEEYYLLFKPLHYQNDYNGLLIELLIAHGNLLLAEKYCLEQIAGNSIADYNMMYLDFLAEIYTIEKDDEKLASVLKETLFKSFDFNSYLFVDKNTEGEEKKKWRTKLLIKSRQLAPYQLSAVLFCFQLLDAEKKYVKMIDYLDSTVTYEIIARYADKMALSRHGDFLREILFRGDRADDENREVDFHLNKLLEVMMKYYSLQELTLGINEAKKRAVYSSPNKFVLFMDKKVATQG